MRAIAIFLLIWRERERERREKNETVLLIVGVFSSITFLAAIIIIHWLQYIDHWEGKGEGKRRRHQQRKKEGKKERLFPLLDENNRGKPQKMKYIRRDVSIYHGGKLLAPSLNAKTKDGVTRNTDAQSTVRSCWRHWEEEKTKHLALLRNCQSSIESRSMHIQLSRSHTR